MWRIFGHRRKKQQEEGENRPIAIFELVVEDKVFNPLNAELNPICHLLALVGAHPIFHVSRIRVKRVGKARN